MFDLAFDYLLFAILSCSGALQISAAYSGIHGLLFLKNPFRAATLGGLIVFLAFLIFFEPGPRHIPDTEGGLAGSQNAGIFFLGAIIALAMTLVISSKLNHSRTRYIHHSEIGLDSLKKTTYVRAVIQKFRHLRKAVKQ